MQGIESLSARFRTSLFHKLSHKLASSIKKWVYSGDIGVKNAKL
jgi:hypothetical protein